MSVAKTRGALGSGRFTLIACATLVVGGTALFTLGPYTELSAAAGLLPEESLTSAAELHGFLAELSPDDRTRYLWWQLWDVLNPLLIGFLGVTLVAWLARRATAGTAPGWLLAIPLVTPAADLCENAILARAVLVFPDQTSLASVLSGVTAIKFAGLGATALVALVLVVCWLWRRYG